MIDEIHVENIALIREASCTFSQGLTVLTGETGAGKTALLSACKLLAGERGDKGAVRDGADMLVVEGRFFARDRSARPYRDVEGEPYDDDLVVSRRLSADGRSRIALNGRMASVGELSRVIAPSIDLCGQHEQQKLLKPANHGLLLDAWIGSAVTVAHDAYRAAFAAASDAARELARVREASHASAEKLDEARFVLSRIDAVQPLEGEYVELAAYLSKAEHAEALALAANGAYASLSGDGGAIDALNAAVSALDGASAHDSVLAEYASSLREVGYVLEDVARDALDYRDSIDLDAESLVESQERFAALQGLLRAYGPRMEDVFARRAEAADAVSLVDDAQQRERAALNALEEAECALSDAADALDAVRMDASPLFSSAVSKQMARLEMGGAQLECVLSRMERSSWTEFGASSIEFMFKPAEGMRARPLSRIASGGEISRVMLSIKVVLGEADDVETLVFDEVDAGVGGAVANALAVVLSELAQTHQVLVVTHLPQIAVAADKHYVVRKSEGDAPETTLEEVSGRSRVVEIARMLSGDATEASLAHAEEMLARSGS